MTLCSAYCVRCLKALSNFSSSVNVRLDGAFLYVGLSFVLNQLSKGTLSNLRTLLTCDGIPTLRGLYNPRSCPWLLDACEWTLRSQSHKSRSALPAWSPRAKLSVPCSCVVSPSCPRGRILVIRAPPVAQLFFAVHALRFFLWCPNAYISETYVQCQSFSECFYANALLLLLPLCVYR